LEEKNARRTKMSVVEVDYKHVVLDEQGVPIIQGTTMKVTELVLGKIAYGWTPEEINVNHPYLTLGQIHSALAYYWDHQEDLDREIERRLKLVDEMRAHSRPVPLVARLSEQGLI
jgi:uncharacterized protein (DUF433 family)